MQEINKNKKFPFFSHSHYLFEVNICNENFERKKEGENYNNKRNYFSISKYNNKNKK